MRTIFLSALVTLMYASSAFGCSIDQLKKVAEDHLERFPSSAEREFYGESTEGGSWQMFEGENGTPHSFVFKFLGETGQSRTRISFINRHDFVIVENGIDYDEPLFAPDHTGKFKVQPAQYYFFCDNKLQLPADTPDGATISEAAERKKRWIFEDAKIELLKLEIQRIPE